MGHASRPQEGKKRPPARIISGRSNQAQQPVEMSTTPPVEMSTGKQQQAYQSKRKAKKKKSHDGYMARESGMIEIAAAQDPPVSEFDALAMLDSCRATGRKYNDWSAALRKLASLDVATGRVIADVRKRRTSKDFLAFLDSVVKEYRDQ